MIAALPLCLLYIISLCAGSTLVCRFVIAVVPLLLLFSFCARYHMASTSSAERDPGSQTAFRSTSYPLHG